MRTGALAWVVGIQCSLLGALMLVAPHQFAGGVYAPMQPHLVEWGSLFLLAGASLLSVAALGLTGPVSAAAHLVAGGTLLALGIAFGLEAAWMSSINYTLLGIATSLSPLLGGTPLRRDHGQRSLLGLTVGVSALAVGFYLLVARPREPSDMLLFNGVTFVGSGVLLMLWTVRPVAGVSLAARLFAAVAFMLFVATSSLPSRTWTGVLLFGGYSLALLVLPWLRRMEQVHIPSLRTRLALALCVAAALPLVVAFAVDAQYDETTNVERELALNKAVAEGIARDAGRLLTGNTQAVASIACVPGLLNYPPDTQTTLLRGLTMVPPVRGWATYDASGHALARSDERPLTDLSTAPIFDAAKNAQSPVLDISPSDSSDPPVVEIAAAARGADGQFNGVVVLDSDQVTQTLFNSYPSQGSRLYLVDQLGRVVAESTVASTSSVATNVTGSGLQQALLTSASGSGALAYQGTDQEWLAGYSSVPGLGAVVVERPTAVALDDVHRRRDVLFGLLVLAATLAVAAGSLVAGWLAEPLKVLAAAVKQLGSGEPDAPLPRSDIIEVALLADNFADLRAQLAEGAIQRGQTDAELRRQLDFTQALTESLGDVGVYAANAGGVLTFVNPAGLDILGWAAGDVGTTNAHDRVHAQHRNSEPASPLELVCPLVEKLSIDPTSHVEDDLFACQNGTLLPVSYSASPIVADGRRVGTIVAFRDVSERKQAEAALRANEERNRLALLATGMGTWDWDVIRDVQSWSAESEALAGLVPGTFEGTYAAFRRSIHPDDWPAVEIESQAMLAEQRDSFLTYRTVWPDGTTRWIEGRGRAQYAADGTLVRVIGTSLDITERKDAEKELRDSEQRFRRQYKGSPLPTYSWLQEGDDFVLQDFNDAADAITDGLILREVGSLASVWYADQPEIVEDLRACAAEQRTLMREMQYRYRTTGRTRQLVLTSVFVPPRTVMVHTEDVTETRHAERQREAMAQSEKLRALGQMASGIAHDLNQSLMLIASYSDLARQGLIQDSPDRAELEDLLATATQAALDGGETVKRLLVFSRATPEHESQLVDLTKVVREVAQLTAPRWRDAVQAEGRHISLYIEGEGHPTTRGSPARLRELLTNLIFNAVDALPNGGTIRLRAFVEDGQSVVEVVDSGVGMSAEVQKRVFEPFFTTKGDAGTGLGLAMVFGIVEQHGGRIEVRSAPGDGTTFRLTLPLVDAIVAAEPSPRSTSQLEPSHHLRVLVVDDEPMMTRAVVRMLKPSGHLVSVAGSGEEALEKLGVEGFDVVVSDMGMGAGMNGWELADLVRRRWPTVRFMLATGWGAALDPIEARTKGVEAVLSKPYQVADLLQALERTDSAA